VNFRNIAGRGVTTFIYICSKQKTLEYEIHCRDVHGGAVAVAFFFEDIEKLHEFGRISVFTNETP
jgi:hypothetical protein